VRLLQALAQVAEAGRLEAARPLGDRREVAQLPPIFLPRHAQTGVEDRVREADELVHLGRRDVVVAQHERSARPQHSPDRAHEGLELLRRDVMQADVAGDEINACIRDGRGGMGA
jgi:hypothetical protein